MKPEEQRALAIECGAGVSPNPCNAELLVAFTEHELDTYTTAVEARRDAKVEVLRNQLRRFDELTDELTDGYGAASCINPLVDMKNAITKIMLIIKKRDTKVAKLTAEIYSLSNKLRGANSLLDEAQRVLAKHALSAQDTPSAT